MNECLSWLSQTLGLNAQPDDSDAKLRAAEQRFLASLHRARQSVIEDGLQVLLNAHDQTIGDDPHFGLPLSHKAA